MPHAIESRPESLQKRPKVRVSAGMRFVPAPEGNHALLERVKRTVAERSSRCVRRVPHTTQLLCAQQNVQVSTRLAFAEWAADRRSRGASCPRI
jgi:hypothetical protein